MDAYADTGSGTLPPWLAPMLAVSGPLPTGDGWAFEVKWDGVRVVTAVGGGRIRARGRSGRDVTSAYPELWELREALGSMRAVVDGEVVAFGEGGLPDFGLLAHRMHVSDPTAARRLAATAPVRYLLFDLLYLDGYPTTELSYDNRRTLLEALALPGLTTPALDMPGLALPGRGAPGAATPKQEAPKLAVPGLAVPGLATPEREESGRAVLGLDVPGGATPKRDAAGGAVPGPDVPGSVTSKREAYKVAVPESFHGDGQTVLAASLDAGLEGVVAKRRGSTYQPGRRSPDWVKVKNVRRQTVVIGGWEPGEGRRAHRIGALLVGVAAGKRPAYPDGRRRRSRVLPGPPEAHAPVTPGGGGFVYAGQVGTGFSDAALDQLAALLAPLRRETPPFPDVPPEYARNAVWVAPELVADVEFGSWTPDGRMRHPSFKGLRDDVDPSDATRDP